MKTLKKCLSLLLCALFVLSTAFAEAAYDPSALYPGDKGDEVKTLQRALIELGWLDGRASGTYNDKTTQAVADFQYFTGLTGEESGVAGEKTQYLLYSIPLDTNYVLNTRTGKYHLPGCTSALYMSEEYKEYVNAWACDLDAQGYVPCALCDPAPMYWDENNINCYSAEQAYVINAVTAKFHYPECHLVTKMSETNRMDVVCTRDELVEQGYAPCSICKP